MRNTFCVRFYCRQGNARKDGFSPVEVSVIVKGERQMWQLPKKCRPDEFLKNKDIQTYCTAVENKLNEIYTNLSINDEAISAYKIKDIFQNGNNAKSYTLKNMFEDGMMLKASDGCNAATYRKYENIIKRFYEYTGHNEQQEANVVTFGDIMKFKAKIESIHQPQTTFKEMQHLKFFFILAFNSGKIKQNPFGVLKIKSGAKDMPYLTYKEIEKVRELKITSDKYDKQRDVFLFMCFTGLEWADMEALQVEDVKTNEYGQKYIKKARVKTGIEYVSVLYEDAPEIWDFYGGNLPLISPQKFNSYIKDIAKEAGIDKNVTSLTARHTYATYLLSEKKLSIDVVAKMLGHTTTSQTKQYAKMLETAVFEATVGSEQPRRNLTRKEFTRAEYEENMDDIEMFNRILGI